MELFEQYKKSTLRQEHLVITIDGPAASGKSSVARLLTQKLNQSPLPWRVFDKEENFSNSLTRQALFLFVSSGYYYRTLAWGVLQKRLIPAEESKIASWLCRLDFQTAIFGEEAYPLLEEIDPREYLFQSSINALVSSLATLPEIRKFVLTKLRSLALDHHLVMEGRDIGSVVFPNAPFKFYLNASLEERVRRRRKEGEIDTIEERDQKDSSRTLAPLMIPEGAMLIDTTNLTVEETAEKMLAHLLPTLTAMFHTELMELCDITGIRDQ